MKTRQEKTKTRDKARFYLLVTIFTLSTPSCPDSLKLIINKNITHAILHKPPPNKGFRCHLIHETLTEREHFRLVATTTAMQVIQ